MYWEFRPPRGPSGHFSPHPGLASGACDPGRVPVGTAPTLPPCPSHLNVVNDVESCISSCTGTHRLRSWSYPHLDATSVFFLLGSPEIFPPGPEFFNNWHPSGWLCTVGKGSRKQRARVFSLAESFLRRESFLLSTGLFCPYRCERSPFWSPDCISMRLLFICF